MAQAVLSASITSSPSRNPVGRQCAATCSPTSESHRESTLAPAAWACQPRSASTSPRAEPKATGSPADAPHERPLWLTSGSPAEPRADSVPPEHARRPGLVPSPPAPDPRPSRAAPPSRAARPRSSTPAPCVSGVPDVVDCAGPHRQNSSAQRRRDVSRHGCGNQHLLRRGQQLRKPLAAGRVEFGEDVVEQEHGSPPPCSPSRSTSYDASRSASASDHDSPWLA